MAEISDDLYERLNRFVCGSDREWPVFLDMGCVSAQLFVDLATAMNAPDSAADIADSHHRECSDACPVAVVA